MAKHGRPKPKPPKKPKGAYGKLLGVLLILGTVCPSFGQKVKRATTETDAAVVVTGVEVNTFNLELDLDAIGQARDTGQGYELFILVSGYTANATTGTLTIAPRHFTRAAGGVKTFVTSSPAVTVDASIELTANGLFNFDFTGMSAPAYSIVLTTVSGDTFSVRVWLTYHGE